MAGEVWQGTFASRPKRRWCLPDRRAGQSAAFQFVSTWVVLLSGLRSDLVPQWRQEVTGFVAVGPREFIALEPAWGGRGDVGRGVGLEMVFDLASDHLAGANIKVSGTVYCQIVEK